MSSRKKLIDNVFFYGLSSYMEYFLGLVITTIIARSLGAEQYGVYSFILWLAAFGVALLSDGLGITAIRFIAELRGAGRDDEVRPLVRYFLKIMAIGAIPVVLVLLAVFFLTADRSLPDYRWLGLFVLLAFIPKAINIFYVYVAKGIEEYSTQFKINLLVNPFNLAAVSIVAWSGGGVREFVLAYLVVSLAYALVSWYLVGGRLREYPVGTREGELSPEESRQILRSVKLMTVTLFLGFIVEKQLEVFVLNFYGMPAEAGLYNAAFILGVSAIGLVPGVLSGVILPIMARAGMAGDDEQTLKYRESSRYLVLLTVPLVCYGAAMSSEIITLVFGQDFVRSAPAFAIVLLASGITVMVHAANSVLLTRDMQQHMLKGVAIGAIINITIDFIAIPRFGMHGALAGFVATLLFISAYNIRLASRALSTRLEWRYYAAVTAVGVVMLIPFVLMKGMAPDAVLIFLAGPIYVALFIAGLFVTGVMRPQDDALLRSLISRIPGLNKGEAVRKGA